MAERLKVVRVDTTGSRAPMDNERREVEAADAELVGADATTEDEVIEACKEADVIITGAAQITRRMMESLPRCRAVVRYGIGYDTVDVAGATDNGILVVNIPDFCLDEVANQAMMLLLACAKHLRLAQELLADGRWGEWWRTRSPMGSLYGETLGLVGCGHIGRTMARRARAFDLKLLGYDPYIDKALAEESGITLTGLPELLKESDYVSLHTPLNQDTRHIIGEAELAQMKPTAYLINTARGAVADEAALIKALQEERIAGAGLDVFEQEPTDPNNPLLKMPNVVVTPHSAAYSDNSNKRLSTSVGQEAARVLQGQWPRNWVNKDVTPRIKLS